MSAEVSYDLPVGLPDPSSMGQASRELLKLPEASERADAINTLFKLVDAILAAPEEAKKRTVKKANETFHRKVGRHPPAIAFLRAVGFVDGDDPDAVGDARRNALLTMPVAYITRLTDAHHTLAMVCPEAGIAAPPLPSSSFNPFQSKSQATDATREVKGKAVEAHKNEADRIRDEVKKRERDLKTTVEQAPPVEMRPTAFWLSAGVRLEHVIKEMEAANEADIRAEKAAENALILSQVQAAKATISQGGTFESADKRRLAELSRKRSHATCILRVVCPDKSVLQVTFRANDKGEHVIAQVGPLLAPHVRETSWYIYQSPPLKKLAPKETLSAAGFCPGATMYLGFDGAKPGPPFLEASLVQQLGPAPAEEQRGVNAPAGPTFSGEAMGWGQGKKLGGSSAAAAPSKAAAPADAAPAAAAPAAAPMNVDADAAARAPADPQPMEQ
eukprot:gnl/TRDRNA2_/TRDRNA2_133615_c0_seq1.p1 gnl/TRDRNA2_/TRDRNA2_133615_c0~~gnl/TRDRNA2_/TRDRNA2_133615_c0_seq1.p1  ORF type:complete len:461 (+),score=99.32 gnl/TRDRNA2_/TRDRNA2_133615_c0_seq1:50-1384(+)